MGPGTWKVRTMRDTGSNNSVNVHKMENRIGDCGIISFVRLQDEQEPYVMGVLGRNTRFDRSTNLSHTWQQASQS